ncbi:MAG: DUF177 domain-containing protein [Bacteroidaceae bacterium]|nr:DUF177 domain-containing protein [Bacteroidaceae bacterium]
MKSFTLTLNDIPADGLTRQWHLDDAFFQNLEDTQYQRGSLDVAMNAKRTTSGADIDLQVTGMLVVQCDRCGDEMEAHIEGSEEIKVRVGENAGDDGDIITVLDTDSELDLSWNIYEAIALAVPLHPVHAEGHCNAEMELLLQQHQADAQPDSRWAALSKLKDTIK